MIDGKYFKFKCHLYDADFHFIIGSREYYHKKIKQLKVFKDDSLDETHLAITITRGKFILVYLPRASTKPEDLNTITHELFHAAAGLLDYIDLEYHKGDTNEAFSYLIGWLTQEFFKRI